MVHNHKVSLLRSIAHACDETGIEIGAFLSQTAFGARINVTPEREMFGKRCEFGSVASFAHPGPMGNLIEIINFIETFQHRRTFGPTQTIETDVVISPLHVSRSELLRQHALQKGNVL